MVVAKAVFALLSLRLPSSGGCGFGTDCADALLLDRFEDNLLKKLMLSRTLEADEDDVCEWKEFRGIITGFSILNFEPDECKVKTNGWFLL